jgi:hypothetical protein
MIIIIAIIGNTGNLENLARSLSLLKSKMQAIMTMPATRI